MYVRTICSSFIIYLLLIQEKGFIGNYQIVTFNSELLLALRTDSKHNDQEVVYSLYGSDSKEFSALYDHFYLSIYYFARKFVTDPQIAEDITAETFIKLWEYAHTSRIENVKSFLHATAKHACLDHLKTLRIHHQKEKEIRYLAEQDTGYAFTISEMKSEILRYIYAEIEKLPKTSREVFKLSFIEGMKNSEIAATLQISEQTVYNLKNIALKTLRLSLKDKAWVLGLFYLYFASTSP